MGGIASRQAPRRPRRDSYPTSNLCKAGSAVRSWSRSLEQGEVGVFQKIEPRDKRLGRALERRQFDLQQRLRGLEDHCERVAILLVCTELVMQMRTGGPASLPDMSYRLALADTLARPQPAREVAQVGVVGAVAAVVSQDDEVAVAAPFPRKSHDTVAGGFHLGSGRRSVVHPLVCPPLLKNRMTPKAKSGGHPREL